MTYIYSQAAPFFLSGNRETALLFIHGFTASPSELYPTACLVHDLCQCTISAPLLPGHGSSPRFLNRTDWKQWFGTVEEELHSLMDSYKRVYVGGLSMGALLSLHALANIPGLLGAIAMNTPIFNRSPILTAASPLIRHIHPYYPKKDRLRLRELEEQGRFAYDVIPVKAFQSMTSLRNLVLQELEELKLPVLLMQSMEDTMVSTRSVSYLQEKLAQAQLLELKHSDHIVTMGSEKEKVAQAIVDFIGE